MTPKKTRRRGDSLTKAIYSETYNLLQTMDIGEITFMDIANATNTSRSVLYRRWNNPLDILIETIIFKMESVNSPLISLTFNKGSLRNDLIYLGEQFLRISENKPAKYIQSIYFYIRQNNNTIQYQNLLENIKASNLKQMKHVLQNAIDRGELSVFPKEVTQLSFFELLRYSTLDTGKSKKNKATEVVDNVIYPAIICTH